MNSNWQELLTSQALKSAQPLVVILGPTASGKTAFSLSVAHFLSAPLPGPPLWGEGAAEVVNADSRQLYRHLNIGTAKITPEEMRGIPHHLIDVLEPAEETSVAQYKDMATRVIDDCHARGVVPLLVGGSMLYLSAIIDGLDPLPPADRVLRERLEQEWDRDDGITLYDRLVQIDPVTTQSFQHQNKHYVVRAMELYEMTGKPPSTLKKTTPPPYDILQLGLRWPPELLAERITQRTHAMLDSGWIEEVEGLMDQGCTPADPAMKSHGYKEIMQWLQSDERDRQKLEEVIAAKSRQYAKRQMTWWRGDPRIQWIDQR